MFDSPQEKIRKWLEKTIKDSQQAVDHGWMIEEDGSTMVIDTEQMPFKIIIQVDDDLTYIAVKTAIYTKDKPVEIAESVFRSLLKKNKAMGLSKFFLMDEDDTLCLRTDLYTQHMDKKEFNLALESTILGGRWLIAELGETEEDNRFAKEMATLGSAELLKGTPMEEVETKMVEAGYPEDQAVELVKSLAYQLGLIEKEEKEIEEVQVQTTEEEDTSAVDRYIW